MLGIEYLWGGPVNLETTVFIEEQKEWPLMSYYYGTHGMQKEPPKPKEPKMKRVLYTMENRKLSRVEL